MTIAMIYGNQPFKPGQFSTRITYEMIDKNS